MKINLNSGHALLGAQCLIFCGLVSIPCGCRRFPEGQLRLYALPEEAKVSFESGDYVKARKDAIELQSVMKDYKTDWNYGNAVHDSNMVLGRLALRRNEVEEAGDYLLAAGDTPGSPQINSFGPNMSLANDMLKLHQRVVVLKYFEECGEFCDHRISGLDRWTSDVKAGKTPDFGANLGY